MTLTYMFLGTIAAASLPLLFAHPAELL